MEVDGLFGWICLHYLPVFNIICFLDCTELEYDWKMVQVEMWPDCRYPSYISACQWATWMWIKIDRVGWNWVNLILILGSTCLSFLYTLDFSKLKFIPQSISKWLLLGVVAISPGVNHENKFFSLFGDHFMQKGWSRGLLIVPFQDARNCWISFLSRLNFSIFN